MHRSNGSAGSALSVDGEIAANEVFRWNACRNPVSEIAASYTHLARYGVMLGIYRRLSALIIGHAINQALMDEGWGARKRAEVPANSHSAGRDSPRRLVLLRL